MVIIFPRYILTGSYFFPCNLLHWDVMKILIKSLDIDVKLLFLRIMHQKMQLSLNIIFVNSHNTVKKILTLSLYNMKVI